MQVLELQREEEAADDEGEEEKRRLGAHASACVSRQAGEQDQDRRLQKLRR